MTNAKSDADNWAIIAFVVLCSAAVATAVYLMRMIPEPLNDEIFDIVIPAIRYIQGDISPNVKYPSFSFYFYGVFIKLTGTVDDIPAAFQVTRWVNMALFAVNLTLFFAFARSIFSAVWALVATLVFLGFPWLWVSAIVVKTESLQLCAVLLTLLAVTRVNVGGGLKWHGIAALGAAIAMSTKLTGFALVLYLVNLWYAKKHALLANRLVSVVLTFTAVFTVVLLATWTNLWILPEILDRNIANPYLSSGPGPLTAVSEWSNLLYGRFGSFFVTSLPMLAGFYGLLWIGSVPGKRHDWLHAVFGVSTLLSLIVALLATRHRVPYAFAGYCLYLFVASADFVRRVGVDGLVRSRAANYIILTALAAVIIFQTGYSAYWAPQWLMGISRANEVSRQINELSDNNLYAFQELRTEGRELGEYLETEKPEYLFVLNHYAVNFCKYRQNPSYAKTCKTFERLTKGETEYRVAERIPLALPFTFLSPDPELRDSNVYLLELDRGSDDI